MIEHTVKTEDLEPNAAVLTWRLERRHPERWGRRRIEVSGPDGEAIPIDARVSAIVAGARAFLGADVTDGALDVAARAPLDSGALSDDQADEAGG